MSTVYLKIKIKSLAEEARIIRKEEHQYKQRRAFYRDRQGCEDKYKSADTIFWSLRWHRESPVGTECRAALLAYGYLRGKTFFQLETLPKKEGKIYQHPHWNRVIDLICKYGPPKQDRDAVIKSLREWCGLPHISKHII
jgi:hypothetical protein